MHFVLISPQERVQNEIETIELFFSLGFKIHIRKPNYKYGTMKRYLSFFNQNNLQQFSIHGLNNKVFNNIISGLHLKQDELLDKKIKNKRNIIYSKSIHYIQEYDTLPDYISYVFLSPIFDSISKKGYKPKYKYLELSQFLSKKRKIPIFALGGISLKTLPIAKKLGFDGVAFMGEIWSNPMENRKSMAKKILEFANYN